MLCERVWPWLQEDRVNVTSRPGRTADDSDVDAVHADTLRYFPDLVRELGGDPQCLVREVGVDPLLLSKETSVLSYRAMVNLLEHAAEELQCPDFGMRLATLQGGGQVFGPVGVVWR